MHIRHLLALVWMVLTAFSARAEQPPVDGVALLQQVERAHAAIGTLAADVSYDRRFLLQGDRHVRFGRFFYRSPSADQTRAFAVLFDRLWVGDRLTDEQEGWVFDTLWLVEEHPRERRFIKRRMASNLAATDPLAPSQSPIPLPVGLRAADVLAQFDAKLVDSTDGVEEADQTDLPFLPETYQALLTPRDRPGVRPQFREVRLWFDRATLLPRMARTVDRARDESWVVLINLRADDPAAVPEDVFSTDAPEPGSGWDVQIEEGPVAREP